MAGLIARVTAFYRQTRPGGAHVSSAKTSPGNEPTLNAEHFGAPGDDGHPLPDDYAFLSRGPRTGRWAALGYLDSRNAGLAGPGERRIYSRDEAGETVASAWLKSDGEVVFDNGAARVTLRPDGEIVADNGAALGVLRPDGGVLLDNGEAFAALTPDGAAEIANGAGSFELQSGGNVVINGVTIDTSGNISTGGSIEGSGVSDTNGGVTLGTHTHGVPPDTPPPTPGS